MHGFKQCSVCQGLVKSGSVPLKDILFPLLEANQALGCLCKRDGIALFATHLVSMDTIQPSKFSSKCRVNVFTERTYVPRQSEYVFQ